jgi:hypothetical protein
MTEDTTIKFRRGDLVRLINDLPEGIARAGAIAVVEENYNGAAGDHVKLRWNRRGRNSKARSAPDGAYIAGRFERVIRTTRGLKASPRGEIVRSRPHSETGIVNGAAVREAARFEKLKADAVDIGALRPSGPRIMPIEASVTNRIATLERAMVGLIGMVLAGDASRVIKSLGRPERAAAATRGRKGKRTRTKG